MPKTASTGLKSESNQDNLYVAIKQNNRNKINRFFKKSEKQQKILLEQVVKDLKNDKENLLETNDEKSKLNIPILNLFVFLKKNETLLTGQQNNVLRDIILKNLTQITKKNSQKDYLLTVKIFSDFLKCHLYISPILFLKFGKFGLSLASDENFLLHMDSTDKQIFDDLMTNYLNFTAVLNISTKPRVEEQLNQFKNLTLFQAFSHHDNQNFEFIKEFQTRIKEKIKFLMQSNTTLTHPCITKNTNNLNTNYPYNQDLSPRSDLIFSTPLPQLNTDITDTSENNFFNSNNNLIYLSVAGIAGIILFIAGLFLYKRNAKKNNSDLKTNRKTSMTIESASPKKLTHENKDFNTKISDEYKQSKNIEEFFNKKPFLTGKRYKDLINFLKNMLEEIQILKTMQTNKHFVNFLDENYERLNILYNNLVKASFIKPCTGSLQDSDQHQKNIESLKSLLQCIVFAFEGDYFGVDNNLKACLIKIAGNSQDNIDPLNQQITKIRNYISFIDTIITDSSDIKTEAKKFLRSISEEKNKLDNRRNTTALELSSVSSAESYAHSDNEEHFQNNNKELETEKLDTILVRRSNFFKSNQSNHASYHNDHVVLRF